MYRSLRWPVLIQDVRIDPIHILMDPVVTDEEECSVRRGRRAVRIFSFRIVNRRKNGRFYDNMKQ